MIFGHGRKRFFSAMPGRSSKVPTKRASKSAALHRVFGQPSHRRSNLVRAGLYARVSTHDQQTLPLQMRAMREYAAKRGWTIAIQIKRSGQAPPNANSVKNSWPLAGGARSMSSWYGGWTDGAGHLSI